MLNIVSVAPVPAVVLGASTEADADATNDAAKLWGLQRGWTRETWDALADTIRGALGEGVRQRTEALFGVHWTAAEAEGRWIAWLEASDAARDRVPVLPVAEAVDLLGLSVWRVDLASARIYQNASGFRLAGIAEPPPIAVGMPVSDVRKPVHPDDLDALRVATERAAAPGAGAADARARHLQADGSYRTVFSRRIAERDAHGRAISLIGVSIDISAQAALEQRERETRQRLDRAERVGALALSTAGFAVWQCDLATGELWGDDQMLRLHGIDPASRSTPDFAARHALPDATRLAVEERVAAVCAALANGEPVEQIVVPSFEQAVRWADGSIHWLCARASVVMDEVQGPQLLGLQWDVTELRQAAQLREERAAAEEASRAKSQALATVSHELRTPLNAVLGLAGRALRAANDPPPMVQMLKIQQSARAMLGLINDILDLAKAEAGRLDLHQAPFRLDDVLGHVRDLVDGQVDEKALSLRFETVEIAGACFIGDALRLGQVLINLVANAVKFTERGGVTLAIARTDEGGSTRLRFAVSDTGPGMDELQLARLFRPFERVVVPSSHGPAGTGLGLTISQRLVEAMGGRIEVASRRGHGSTFSFEIDLPPSAAVEGRPATRLPPQDLRGVRILLVEDNEINQELASGLLTDAGAEVAVADNGREAIDRLDAGSYDVVLMDCQMAVMDGYEATQEIRRQPRWAGLPIVALSANAGADDRRRALAAGMSDYIVKPFELDELLATTARWAASR